MNELKITKDLDIDFSDLMLEVDADCEFTLRDVLRIAVSSTHIPVRLMSEILRCRALEDFYKEMEDKPFDGSDDFDYLELYWEGERSTYKGKVMDGSGWSFHGVGKEGVVPEDMSKHMSIEEVDKIIYDGYRQKYAIELSPIYKLANYPIKICDEIIVADGDKVTHDITKCPLRPSITLIELLYGVIWEISFFGSPAQRNAQKEELDDTINEIDKFEEEGRLDEVMVPWEEVKERLKQKFDVDVDNKKEDN